MPMALRDKLNSLAAEAASKANTAIENGKLSLKINNEEKKIDEFTLNIGELVLDKLDGGETFDDEIMALYSSIEASRQGEEAEEDALSPTCSSCGAALSQEDNFCAHCGVKVEKAPAAVCPACGAVLSAEAVFCSQCGSKLASSPSSEADGAE